MPDTPYERTGLLGNKGGRDEAGEPDVDDVEPQPAPAGDEQNRDYPNGDQLGGGDDGRAVG